MSLEQDVAKLVSQVIWDTVGGNVSWQIIDPPRFLVEGTSDLIPCYVECRYKGRQTIGVYEKRYRHYVDEDQFYWASNIVLVLLDDFRRIIYESNEPDIQINNLFGVARDSASNVNSIVKSLIQG